MGKYLGYVLIRNNFYNFHPTHEISEEKLIKLTDEDYKELIPESEKRDINFSYYSHGFSENGFMENNFHDKQLIIFNFELSDLEDSINYTTGTRNKTGYKIEARKARRKIEYPEQYGIYRLIKKEECSFSNNITNRTYIDINANGLNTGDKVCLELLNNFYEGPYTIKFKDDQFYVLSNPKQHNYLIEGYDSNSCKTFQPLYGNDDTFIQTNHGSKKKVIDVIDDKALLDGLKNDVTQSIVSESKIDLNDLDNFDNLLNSSPIFSKKSNEKIIDKRIDRLKKIISSSLRSNEKYQEIIDIFGSSLSQIIELYDKKNSDNSLINQIVDADPEIINLTQKSKLYTEKIQQLEDEIEQLSQNIDLKKESDNDSQHNNIELSKSNDLSLLDEEIEEKEIYLSQLKDQIEKYQSDIALYDKHEELEQEIKSLETLIQRYKEQIKDQKKIFNNAIEDVDERFAELSIDGYMANKLQEISSGWENNQKSKKYNSMVDCYKTINASQMGSEELIDYLCDTVKIVRSNYDDNTIINIAICLFQNRITVFSGEPGCGKTSICNIFARVLGLSNFEKSDNTEQILNRYVSVSVERGWTSKRDLIGYYNPLTKTYDQSNQQLFDVLQIANREYDQDSDTFPIVVLLDEANLSPIEYYWADFMNTCDDLESKHQISIGGGDVLNIPKTLHFVATINNDHTTESLSPRMIDRAAVISLPNIPDIKPTINTIPEDKLTLVPWSSIEKTFVKSKEEEQLLPESYKKITDHFKKINISISPRTKNAIRNYFNTACQLFKDDELGREKSIVALDYAVSQHLLTKVNGSGDAYLEWIEELNNILKSNNLVHSSRIVENIRKKGKTAMNYYQFFA